MRWTLYGIPRTVKQKFGVITSGSIGDTLWKVLVVVVLLTIGLGLVALGPIGAVVGGILIATLVSDDVRAFVDDVWNRRWAEIEAPL